MKRRIADISATFHFSLQLQLIILLADGCEHFKQDKQPTKTKKAFWAPIPGEKSAALLLAEAGKRNKCLLGLEFLGGEDEWFGLFKTSSGREFAVEDRLLSIFTYNSFALRWSSDST
jgi:hypothetical protein